MKAPRQPHTLCMISSAGRRHRRAEHAGEGVHREGLADALAPARAATAAHSRPGGRRCCRCRRGANIATNSQNEWTRPTTAKAAAPISRPAISRVRAPSRSTRKPGRRLQRGRDDVEGGEAPGRSRCSSRRNRRARTATAAPAAGCNNARRNAPRSPRRRRARAARGARAGVGRLGHEARSGKAADYGPAALRNPARFQWVGYAWAPLARRRPKFR